jgi:hypothetical protein
MNVPVLIVCGGTSLLCGLVDGRSIALLAHLVEIFIKDPLRAVPWTLRGLVSSIDVCMDTFHALYNVLKVQMPRDIDAEDGLIYHVLRKSEGVSQAAQTAKAWAGKLNRSVDEMRSQGLTVELRHVASVDGCYQQTKGLADCYRKVCVIPTYNLIAGGFRIIQNPTVFSIDRSSSPQDLSGQAVCRKQRI